MEYINVVNQRYRELASNAIIHPKFKVEMIDHSEQIVSREITQDIDAEGGSSISINYQQGVRMSCTLTINNSQEELSPSALNGLFWIGSKFRLYVGLVDDINDDVYWFSEGVYYVNSPSDAHDVASKIVTVQGVDKFGIFGSELGYNQLVGTYHIDSGKKVYDVIKEILMMDMGNGQIIDPIEPILDPLYKDEIMPYDINKAPGSYLADILIELANILGANIFYNKMGRLTVKSGTTDMSYSQDAPIWHFSDNSTEYMSSTVNYDYPNVINVVQVIGSNINGDVYTYTAENHNPLSPTRISYIGRKEITPIEAPLAYDEGRVRDYAKFKLKSYAMVQHTFDFQCALIPHLDVDMVCTITDKYYKFEQERMIIQSVNIPLSINSLMSVSCTNIASLPYYELMIGGA